MSSRKNDKLKKANEEVELSYDNLQELYKCSVDPIYFARNYVKIQHPVKGAIPFDLYDYQEDMFKMFANNRYSIVLSARQSGKSVSSVAYLLWFSIFHEDKTILIASNKNANAMEMISRISYSYQELPNWLKPGVDPDNWNKHSIGFDNGTRIISEATSENSGRGLSISLVYLDEFAFVKPSIQKEFWTSIAPTLSTGGSCIITSTPNGDSDIFAEIWRGAQAEVNGFAYQFVKWSDVPGRDENFKQQEIGKLGERRWLQEYECEFLSADALLIDTIFLTSLTGQLKDLEPIVVKNDFDFFHRFKQGGTYLIGIDPSTGSGGDYSVMTIFDFPDLVQIGQYRSNTMSSNELYKLLKSLLLYLERIDANVYFSVENNGVGEGIIALYDADEQPPQYAEFVSEEGKNRQGMTTTNKSKMKACVALKELLQAGTLKIQSKLLLAELKAFTRSRGSYAAQSGSTDDCIMALLVVVRILENLATYDQDAFETLYSNTDVGDSELFEY